MLLGHVFDNPATLQKTVLILNTLLVIAALLVLEFINNGRSKKKKQQFRKLYPIFVVLLSLLGYAVYLQGAA